MTLIKRILIVTILAISTISCLPEDDQTRYRLELLKVESVNLPDTLVLGETHQIEVSYFRPTNCHQFNGFYYDKNLNVRTIAIQSLVAELPNCTPLQPVLEEATLNFYVTNNGSYIFKFWKGKNDLGEDTFMEIEVPVKD